MVVRFALEAAPGTEGILPTYTHAVNGSFPRTGCFVIELSLHGIPMEALSITIVWFGIGFIYMAMPSQRPSLC